MAFGDGHRLHQPSAIGKDTKTMTIKERAGALFSHDAGVSVGVPKWDRDLIGLNLSPSLVLRFVAQHLSHLSQSLSIQ